MTSSKEIEIYFWTKDVILPVLKRHFDLCFLQIMYVQVSAITEKGVGLTVQIDERIVSLRAFVF